jgi:hypothetical protein
MRLPRPLFLPKSRYRLRRLYDAARMLPVFGAFLVFLPILWAPEGTAPRETAGDGIYLFVVWVGLIAMGFILSRQLATDDTARSREED